MDRLTFCLGKTNRTYGLKDKASAKVGLFTDYDGFIAHLQATNRLGQYEDTGLTPEEITEAQKAMNAALGLACSLQAVRKENVVLLAESAKLFSENNAADRAIIELTDENANIRAELEALRTAQTTHHCENCERMGKKIEQVKAEREAAVNDLRDNADRPCYVCAKRINGRCTLPPPKDCAGFFRWEWRGLQKEEPNA